MNAGLEIKELNGAGPHELALRVEQGDAVLTIGHGRCELNDEANSNGTQRGKDIRPLHAGLGNFPTEELVLSVSGTFWASRTVPGKHSGLVSSKDFVSGAALTN
jgi:hypothetical protein